MTNLFRSVFRSDPTISLDEWVSYFQYGGLQYPFIPSQTLSGDKETIDSSFEGYVQGAYKSNGVVFACMLARLLLFSEARFQFRQLRSGRPGDLFGSPVLGILEKPWPNGTTGDLLTRIIQDVDLGGNSYIRREGNRLRRLRPDWVTIVMGDADLVGYAYQHGGPGSGYDPIYLLPEEVAHVAPVPDPCATYRGMSWITPVIREILGDNAASSHKLKFFENGATPNLLVTYEPDVSADTIKRFMADMEARNAGHQNAYKTLHLGGGTKDAKVVGADMRQIDFKVTQGAGETRIAAAAGVPPVIVGLSEGLQSATYSNYGQARRRFADGTMRPLWRNVAGSLAKLIQIPAGSELWYDDRDIPFLQEDQKDAAEIQSTQAQSIKALVEAGYEPKSVIDAINAGDFNRLKHTGLYSVQLQEPGAQLGSGSGASTAPQLPPGAP